MDFQDLKKAEAAMLFAIKKHGAQKYGDQPYLTHLVQVVNVLSEFGYSDNLTIISAGWLHDVLEDTDATREELASKFGTPIAYAVWCVTSEIEGNRMHRLQSVIPKLESSEPALIVKLADRIANTEKSKTDNNRLHSAYSRENYLLRECFYRRKFENNLNLMWDRLIAASDKPSTEKKQ